MLGNVGHFRDRADGGRQLARLLRDYRQSESTVVLGLPRGGVVTAFEVAKQLDLPLDVVVVRKVGTPGQEELAMGAVARGVRIENSSVIHMARVSAAEFDRACRREEVEVERREKTFRAGRAPLDLKGKIAIIVDDGLATGATMKAAIASVKKQGAAKIVVAVPVAAADSLMELDRDVEYVCVLEPYDFLAVGVWYEDFPQTSDSEVRSLLDRARVPAYA